jgi:serine/threonine protein kinase
MTDWRLGSYHLQRKLGEGGMAQVYLARDVRLDREVAVKVLDRKLADRPGFQERFMREARLAAALDHPNIVPLYDFGDEDALYLVMPYLSGGSLQDMLSRTPLQTGEVVTYGSQIADALDYAHQHKVVHRDVKPANMLLHADGRLMLSDFGLAKIVSQTNTPNAPRNRPDAGTPEYMAPEQVVGSSDARSDIYGLGVVLYLLLTGRLPFTGSSSREVMEAHLRNDPAPPRRYNPAIPPAMEAVVLRAMAKQPGDRYQRASELGAALLGALISDQTAESLSFTSAPSGASRPGDMPPFVSDPARSQGYPSDRPTGGAPQWIPAALESAEVVPPTSAWGERRPSSSITGLLPDLDLPFTTLNGSEAPGAPELQLPAPVAFSGQWGSFAGSHAGSSPGSGASAITGRIPSAPVSPAHRLTDTSPHAFAQVSHSRPTAAPWGSRSTAGLADSRAALPGIRTTPPPDAPAPRTRSSRLWIAIALLLIVMLFAAIALLRYYQMTQAALH